MTSETWVWIHLPGALGPTLCGVHRHDGRVGRFTYGRSYLAASGAVPIDPVLLPLQEREYPTAHLGGWFSSLLDAGPDAWGRRIIDRSVGPQDQRGYLLHARGQPVGAITFSDRRDTPPLLTATTQAPSLAETLALHARVEAGEPLSADETGKLMGEAGTGGARPKLTLEDRGTLWLVKGVSVKDKEDYAPVPVVEAALLRLASELDIDAPRTEVCRIAGNPVLMVERFDRRPVEGGYARWRYASAQTLLWSAPQVAQWSFQGSYTNLARRMAAWERSPAADIRQLYRRIVFNALAGNLDDHEKNHGFVADAQGNFHLSPVFDLNISATTAERQELMMPFGSEGALISLPNLLSECTTFGYSRADADVLIQSQWSLLRTKVLPLLIELGCDEARALRTTALMPGHRMLGG